MPHRLTPTHQTSRGTSRPPTTTKCLFDFLAFLAFFLVFTFTAPIQAGYRHASTGTRGRIRSCIPRIPVVEPQIPCATFRCSPPRFAPCELPCYTGGWYPRHFG